MLETKIKKLSSGSAKQQKKVIIFGLTWENYNEIEEILISLFRVKLKIVNLNRRDIEEIR